MAQPRSKLARWRMPLQILFAVLAMAWVLRIIPWNDVLIHSAEAGETSIDGELLGDWKQDSVRFRPAPVSSGLPAELAALPRAPDGSWSLVRSAPSGSAAGIDWRPGMLRVFREVDRSGLALALGLFALGQMVVVTRWLLLLRAAGLVVSWFESFRMTCMGIFFNLVVPGLTGGDLVKALLAARAHPEQKHAALVSVAFDRLLGLLCMVLLAALAVLLSGSTFDEIRKPVLATAVVGSLGAIAVLSRGLRRMLGLDRLLARLPLAATIQKLDESVMTYSSRPRELAACVVLSFLNHLSVIGGILVLGRAFGDDVLAWSSYFAIAPVATIVSALPIAPGGWGFGEAAYSYLFAMLGASAAIGLATSITFRLLQMAISLAAGLILFVPGSARLADMKDLSKTEG